MHKKQKTILVTGHSGLLGSEIIGMRNAVGISSNECDLLSKFQCQYTLNGVIKRHNPAIDCVIHCAAKVGGVKANSEFVADFFDNNIRMNMNVLESCKKTSIKLVSILSTCVYPTTKYVSYPLTEDQLHMGPPHKSNFGYAYAKRMLDVQSRAYRDQYGCNFITVIPNNLYGPNDNYDVENGHVIPALVRKFYEAKLHQKPVVSVWGTGDCLREFTFAKDAAKIILWLAENYNGESPVNIGNTDEISIKNLAFMIAKETGYEGEIVFDSSMPEGQLRKLSSNEYLLSLGWVGDYTPIELGLKETVQHFKNHYPKLRGAN